VIIDAIDECEEITRERFLQSIIKLTDQSSSTDYKPLRIKFLVTSRPFLEGPKAANHLQMDPSQSRVEEDLRLVIQTKVEGIIG
jgi:ankyrin repeat domain-containing protein 50